MKPERKLISNPSRPTMKFKIKEIDFDQYYYHPSYGVVKPYDAEKLDRRLGMSAGFVHFKRIHETSLWLPSCGIDWFKKHMRPIVVQYSDLVEEMIEDLPI